MNSAASSIHVKLAKERVGNLWPQRFRRLKILREPVCLFARRVCARRVSEERFRGSRVCGGSAIHA
jgi:hypothetical protein